MKRALKLICLFLASVLITAASLVGYEVYKAHQKQQQAGWALGFPDGAAENVDLNKDGEPELVRLAVDRYNLRTTTGWVPVHIKNSHAAILGVRFEPTQNGGRRATNVLQAEDGRTYKFQSDFKTYRETNWLDWPILPALGFYSGT